MTRRQPAAPAPEAATAKPAKTVRPRKNGTTGTNDANGTAIADRAHSANDATAAPVGETDSTRLDRIREAAYRMYVARGHRDGHDVEDWLAAEAALDGEPAPPACAAPH